MAGLFSKRKREAGLEGVLELFLDDRNGKVRDVYADPLAVELLRGVNWK